MKKHHLLGLCGALAFVVAPGCSSIADLPSVPVTPVTLQAAKLSDTEFAKQGFRALTLDEPTAQTAFDWDNLNTMGTDVGQMYRSLETEDEKDAFRTSFTSTFSQDFLKGGASADNMLNWRVQQENAQIATIIANNPNTKMTITVDVSNNGGTQKITSFNMVPSS